VETNATRMCQLLVGLPSVTVLGVADLLSSLPLQIHVETRVEGAEHCRDCGVRATVKDRDRVRLVDLPAFGRRTRLVWRKRRWRCPERLCPNGSWTERAPAIASPRLGLTDGSAPGSVDSWG
jgi:transposase